MVDQKAICNYGALRYKEYGASTRVTDDFYGAVRALPTTYSANSYYAFIEAWGTVSSGAQTLALLTFHLSLLLSILSLKLT